MPIGVTRSIYSTYVVLQEEYRMDIIYKTMLEQFLFLVPFYKSLMLLIPALKDKRVFVKKSGSLIKILDFRNLAGSFFFFFAVMEDKRKT